MFSEIISEVELPSSFNIGPASVTLGIQAGGSAGDWINSHFGIPSAEVEIGSWDEIPNWMPKTNIISYKLAQESWRWIKHSFLKLGN